MITQHTISNIKCNGSKSHVLVLSGGNTKIIVRKLIHNTHLRSTYERIQRNSYFIGLRFLFLAKMLHLCKVNKLEAIMLAAFHHPFLLVFLGFVQAVIPLACILQVVAAKLNGYYNSIRLLTMWTIYDN